MARSGRARAAVTVAKHQKLIAEKIEEGEALGKPYTQAQIVDWMVNEKKQKTSQATVSRDIAALRGQWAQEARRDYYPRMWEMLEAARYVQGEAQSAWEESKKPREVVRVRQVGEKTHTEAIREPGRPGAEYLGMLIKAMETEMKMLGMGKETLALEVVDMGGLSDDELRRIADGTAG